MIITAGAYVNHITRSLGFEIDLDIWEMTSQYYNVHEGVEFPSMWFYFGKPKEDAKKHYSNLFYGFPECKYFD